ncbi:hypothetical protein BH09MYX1_BH09MYX1_13450 [soil metagenome]
MSSSPRCTPSRTRALGVRVRLLLDENVSPREIHADDLLPYAPASHATLLFMSTAGRLDDDHPVILALRSAPPSDVPLTDEDIAALEAAKSSDAWRTHAQTVSALDAKKPSEP